MSYIGEGDVSAVYRPVRGLPSLAGPTTTMQFVAPGSVTRRQFGLFRREMQPHSGGPDPHFHRIFSESFYVLRGTVRLYNGEQWVDATAGDFLYVPKGGIHAFNHDADEPATMLILFAPGTPREGFFKEMEAIRASGRELSPEEWTQVLAKHDQYMI